jgi:GMP synthase (glutamine-hydrolysing)
MKRVLVAQHAWEDPPGTLGEMMQERNILFDTVKVEEAPLPDLDQYDAFIILGGPQHAGDDHIHPYLVQEKALIRKAVVRDIPYLGVCLGGQLLAHAMDAPVYRNAQVEIGFYEVQLTQEGKNDPLFQGLPDYQQVFHWHADTFELPAGAMLLATGDNNIKQAFRFGRRAYGLQYHIELTVEMFDTWMHFHPHRQEAIEVLGRESYESIEQQRSMRYPTYREHTRILFENFLAIGGLYS